MLVEYLFIFCAIKHQKEDATIQSINITSESIYIICFSKNKQIKLKNKIIYLWI